MIDLDATKESLKLISPWPWRIDHCEDDGYSAEFTFVCDTTSDDGDAIVCEIDRDKKEKIINAQFIAQAPQTISKLVAEVESLRFELEDRFGTEDILVETRHKLTAANAELERLRKQQGER